MAACTLGWSPVVNNVEKCGGLPEEICSAAKHIMANGGGGRQRAIAAAVNFVKFVCATGKSKNFLQSNPGHDVAPEKRARACANVAEWNKLRACMKGKPFVEGKAATHASRDGADLDAVEFLIDVLDLGDALTIRALGNSAQPKTEDGKALCHLGSCSHLSHDFADFKAMLDMEPAITEDEKGLTIRGLAADFSPDREDEAFEPRAFDDAIKSFMENPVLAYFHSTDVVETVKGASRYVQLGAVKSLVKSDRGLEFEAFIPRPAHGGFLANVYDQIKAGIMKGVSVGGRFFKHFTPQGWKIYRADLQEITIAPKPVNPRTLVEAVSVAKADLALDWHPLEELTPNLIQS